MRDKEAEVGLRSPKVESRRKAVRDETGPKRLTRGGTPSFVAEGRTKPQKENLSNRDLDDLEVAGTSGGRADRAHRGGHGNLKEAVEIERPVA